MQIINLGNKLFNNYLLKTPKGSILIDAGNNMKYERFLETLCEKEIDINEIKYIFLTHVHTDHISYLKELLEKTDIKIILHSEAVERLKIARNILGDCSSFMSRIFSALTKVLGKSEEKFEKVKVKEQAIVVEGDSDFLQEEFDMKIVGLPGHTPDSIAILTKEKYLFCGDMFVNTFPSKHRKTLLIEDIEDYKKSWQKVIDLKPQTIYPAHGNSFGLEEVKKYQTKLNKMILWKNP